VSVDARVSRSRVVSSLDETFGLDDEALKAASVAQQATLNDTRARIASTFPRTGDLGANGARLLCYDLRA
jgi:hypothetical protein